MHQAGHRLRFLKPVLYTKFNIKKVYILPKQCIYLLCLDIRTNGYYFTIQQ